MKKGKSQQQKKENPFFKMNRCFIGMREEVEKEISDRNPGPEGNNSGSLGFCSELKVLTKIVQSPQD